MACTTATCTVPIRFPNGGAGASLASMRAAAARRGSATHPVLGGARGMRFPVGPSGISAPEGSKDAAADCGCGEATEGATCGAGGCGPSCGCAPCTARYGNAQPVATPITAFSMGYPAGPAALHAARARADAARASLGADVAEEIRAEEIAPSAGPGWERATHQAGSYPSRAVVLAGLTPGSRVYANGIMGDDLTLAPMPTGDPARWITANTSTDGTVDAWVFGVPEGTSSVFARTPDGQVYAIRLPTLNAGLAVENRVTIVNMLPLIRARQAQVQSPRMTVAERRDALAQPFAPPTVASLALAQRPSGAAAGPHGYTQAQWTAMSPQTREAARLMALARPAGAVSAPVRPWAELSDAERIALMRQANDRALARDRGIAPSGLITAPPEVRALGYDDMRWSALSDPQRAAILAGTRAQTDTLPDWAREAGISQATWLTMNAEQREAARQRANAPGQGWNLAGGLITGATTIVNSVLAGDLQRDLAQIAAASAQGVAERNAASAAFIARSNERIAELQVAAAQAAAAGAPAQAAQFQQAIATMQQAQTAAQNQNQQNMNALAGALAQLAQNQQARRDSGMSPVVVGGGVLALGAVAFLALRKR